MRTFPNRIGIFYRDSWKLKGGDSGVEDFEIKLSELVCKEYLGGN